MKSKAWLTPLILLIAIVMTARCFGQNQTASSRDQRPAFRPDRFIVKFKEPQIMSTVSALEEKTGTQTIRIVSLVPAIHIERIIKEQPMEKVLQEYAKNPAVEYAEPDYYVYALEGGPNDSEYSKLWGLHNEGTSPCVNHADISAEEAWKIRHDASNVIVAVIDTGSRYTHEDLKDNMWRNPGESGGGKETNGKDDDGNGWVDDVHGINATSPPSGDPMDDNGHGTHCAGTVGAVGNNAKGVVGVAWKVQVMACKFIGSDGTGSTSDAIDCINYAALKGAHVMSNSWGGGGNSQALKDAIAAAGGRGIIFVAAAGNDARNNDTTPTYPASYGLPNMVVVASTTCRDELSRFSNFGKHSVHLAAPGSDIFSTYFSSDSSYKSLSGTSMATPHVAGALALIKAQFPQMSHTDLIAKLLKSVDKPSTLAGKLITDGRLNLQKALE